MDETFTRRFDRPHNHTEQAMKTELAGLPGRWKIYGIDSFPSGRRFHVEFRANDEMLAALKNALSRLDSAPA